MPHRELRPVDLVSIAAPGDIVAIVGAGGKTSTMFALSRALTAAGRRVLTTKSTIIYRPTMAQSPGVWQGVPADRMTELRDAARADHVIVEADGARGRWIKAPADHEPVMPADATVVMPVVNLRAVGERINSKHVHRPESVAALLGISVDGVIGVEHVPRVLLDASGGLKRVPAMARVWPVLAGVDAVAPSQVEALVQQLAGNSRVSGVLAADREWRYTALAA